MGETPDDIDLAQRLIRRASVTPRDDGALDILAEALAEMGFECHRLGFGTAPEPRIENLYARRGRSGPHFCFAGHTDVVPAGDEAAWSSPPFAGAVRDGMLVGRGAADMKGAIAAFVGAAKRFLDRRGDVGSISLMITGDEEGAAVNGTARLIDWLEARGERIDGCLVGEPTCVAEVGDTIKIGRRGSLNGTLVVRGTGGHTAYPHLADNPAHRLALMLADLVRTPLDEGSARFAPSSLQISTIDIGNPTTNVIPSSARASFNVRFNDLWTGAAIETWLRERLAAQGGDWTLDVRISGEAFLTPAGALSDLVAAAVVDVTGTAPELSTSGGTSDARFIRRVAPVVELGLVGRTMHKIDEAVPLADLALLGRIYESVLDRFFAGATP